MLINIISFLRNIISKLACGKDESESNKEKKVLLKKLKRLILCIKSSTFLRY